MIVLREGCPELVATTAGLKFFKFDQLLGASGRYDIFKKVVRALKKLSVYREAFCRYFSEATSSNFSVR